MGYVDENLTAGEVVLHRTRLHSITLWLPMFLGLAFGLPGLVGMVTSVVMSLDQSSDIAGLARGMFTTDLVMVLAAAGTIAWGIVQRASTEMAVTNKRVIAKSGVFARKTTEILLPKVESVGVDQGVLGRMAGYGHIVVKGTGGTAERFSFVENPLEFRHCLQEQIERAPGDVAGAATGGPSVAPPGSPVGKFCPHCGAPLSGEGLFCPGCGARRGA